MYQIQLMTLEHAEEIKQWRYDGIYAIYNFGEDSIDELMNNEYYSCVKENHLIGYFCFGKSAQIPTVEKDIYNGNALDIGLGLKPALCGKGLGREFMNAGIQFSKTDSLRLSVAAFNKRAIALYKSLGFTTAAQVQHLYSNESFDIMTYYHKKGKP